MGRGTGGGMQQHNAPSRTGEPAFPLHLHDPYDSTHPRQQHLSRPAMHHSQASPSYAQAPDPYPPPHARGAGGGQSWPLGRAADDFRLTSSISMSQHSSYPHAMPPAHLNAPHQRTSLALSLLRHHAGAGGGEDAYGAAQREGDGSSDYMLPSSSAMMQRDTAYWNTRSSGSMYEAGVGADDPSLDAQLLQRARAKRGVSEGNSYAVEEPTRKRGKHLMERLLWNGSFLRCPGKNCSGLVERSREPDHGEQLVCSVRGCNRKLYYCKYCHRAYVIVTEPDWTLGEHGLEICHMEDREQKRRIVEEACRKYRREHPGSKRYPPWQRRDIPMEENPPMATRGDKEHVFLTFDIWDESDLREAEGFMDALGVPREKASGSGRNAEGVSGRGDVPVPACVASALTRLYQAQRACVVAENERRDEAAERNDGSASVSSTPTSRASSSATGGMASVKSEAKPAVLNTQPPAVTNSSSQPATTAASSSSSSSSFGVGRGGSGSGRGGGGGGYGGRGGSGSSAALSMLSAAAAAHAEKYANMSQRRGT